METISIIAGTTVVILFLYLGCRECYRDYHRAIAASKELEEARNRVQEPRTLPVLHITDPRVQ